MTTDLLETALHYATRGWRVHPLHHPTITEKGARCSCARGYQCPDKQKGKHPRLGEWPDQATTDATIIRAWWKKWPRANIGIVTGPGSGLAVLDIDPRNGGHLTLETLIHQHGPLPETPIVLSGGGGQHYDFLLTDDLPSIKLDGIDFLTAGHYVLVPPSLHPSGQRYTWELSSELDDLPLAEIPAWLRTLVEATAQAYTVAAQALPPDLPTVDLETLTLSTTIKTVITLGNKRRDPYPSRSEALFAVETSMIRAGYDDATIAAVLLDPQYGISDKPLHQKDPRAAQYWTLTKGWIARDIARARAKVAAADARPAHEHTPRDAPRMWRAPPPHAATEHTRQAAASTSTAGEAQSWWKQLTRTSQGKPLQTYTNVALIFDHHPYWHDPARRFWYDEARGEYMSGTTAVSEEDVTHYCEWLGTATGMNVTSDKLVSRVVNLRCKNDPHDLLRDALDALPAWDGVERLEHWLADYAGVSKTAYTMKVAQVLPVAMIARGYEPGCQYRSVVVLCGPENSGKTKLLRALASQEWFVEMSCSLEGKEAHLMLRGVWLAEFSELESIGRTGENRLKSYITMEADDYIPKFSNRRERVQRRTVFAGTTNEPEFLKGQTGNTRYLPVQCGAMDPEGLLHIRLQLLAEAKAYYLAHRHDWWQLGQDAETAAVKERDRRREKSPYEDRLASDLLTYAYRQETPDETQSTFLAWPTMILDHWVVPVAQQTPGIVYQINKALRALGWTYDAGQRRLDYHGKDVRVRPWQKVLRRDPRTGTLSEEDA